MATFKLYIGSNNTTKRVEQGKIERVLNKYFMGYTVEKCIGYWQGTRENSVSVLVDTDEQIEPVIDELKVVLKQDAIAYQVVTELIFR